VIEREQEVRMFEVSAHCSECDGLLVPTGELKTTEPAGIIHKCNLCKKTEVLKKRYPSMRYVPVDCPRPDSPPPKCPQHPEAHIGVARNAASDQYRYVCYTGGCNLGDAPTQPEAGWEPG